ncbi:hypothetical protein NS506_05313 [Nocardia seriolae]|uniref:Uncharacterized protein n=1 Tax=Nocardia seriolae TaxID=37332 RepID=A0ABC8AYK4_9NOCA|nr:hypothetical protein NS506_05313 [Nocardia seriolae]
MFDDSYLDRTRQAHLVLRGRWPLARRWSSASSQRSDSPATAARVRGARTVPGVNSCSNGPGDSRSGRLSPPPTVNSRKAARASGRGGREGTRATSLPTMTSPGSKSSFRSSRKMGPMGADSSCGCPTLHGISIPAHVSDGPGRPSARTTPSRSPTRATPDSTIGLFTPVATARHRTRGTQTSSGSVIPTRSSSSGRVFNWTRRLLSHHRDGSGFRWLVIMACGNTTRDMNFGGRGLGRSSDIGENG